MAEQLPSASSVDKESGLTGTDKASINSEFVWLLLGGSSEGPFIRAAVWSGENQKKFTTSNES